LECGLDRRSDEQIPKRDLPTAADKRFDDIGNSLHGATAISVVVETIAHRSDWNYQSWASQLTHQPLLIIGASRGRGEDNRMLAEAVTAAGGKVTAVTFESDHGFQDHRIALAAEVVDWLQKLP
jgi:tripartite-type tricarboxylate transporter receptor subunit TctC